jgi:hypothetical protein
LVTPIEHSGRSAKTPDPHTEAEEVAGLHVVQAGHTVVEPRKPETPV